ncbi:hypothetical protein TIFTF001_024412 [Ficus carica]|uniref:Uncharacterized protein n=1 Tax=Ficus carica TaxID=3494 RepID=A0AA88DEQ0_FICCA|nr:hypothetical protein TIFTF001_024412 [Ficus carica]
MSLQGLVVEGGGAKNGMEGIVVGIEGMVGRAGRGGRLILGIDSPGAMGKLAGSGGKAPGLGRDGKVGCGKDGTLTLGKGGMFGMKGRFGMLVVGVLG